MPPVTPDPPRPGQRSVWDFPRPAVAEATGAHLVVRLDGRTIADTRRGVMTLETSHPPGYYIPPDDVDLGCLRQAPGSTGCEWKGRARYFDIVTEGRRLSRAAWSYPAPTGPFAALRDHLSFYPQRCACFVDGEAVVAQEGAFYGGWITSAVAGPFKGAPGTQWW